MSSTVSHARVSSATSVSVATGTPEVLGAKISAKINWLRAGVLGANDGVISVAAVAVGVAAATTNVGLIAAAGLAALIGGALSMAIGEYVSVSSQRDALRFHLDSASDIDPDEAANPWAAAIASAVSFGAGGILPFLGATLIPAVARIPLTFVIVFAALAVFGVVSAKIGGGSSRRATLRMVVGGALALAATFAIGAILHTTGVAH